jgi:hypothetical protein
MKHILLLISVVTLLTTTACIFPGHRGGGDYGPHQEYRGHEEGGHGQDRERLDYRSYPEPEVDFRIRG